MSSHTTSPYAIGIDIGVTNIKSVCVTESGEVLSQQQIATEAEDPKWPERVRGHVGELRGKHGTAKWLGVAAPGMARADGVCISWMEGRLEEVQGLDWTKFLGWPSFVPVLNDAQAALLGEAWKGAAAGTRNAILLTLGTGVGGAAMCDGRILKGHLGRAGHLGHIAMDIDGALDVTNCPGSLEVQMGNYTIKERSRGRFNTTHELVAAYDAGDKFAAEVWLRSVKHLAAAIASFVNVFDPEVVIVGGGIAVAGPALFGPLEEYLAKYEWRPHGHRARIVRATLGEHAGALGAACNAIRHLSESAA
jgi:glucokinase